MRTRAERLLRRLPGLMPDDLHAGDLARLVSPHGHFQPLGLRRSTMVVNRVRLFAFLFAILTPLWSVIDFFLFPYPLWLSLAVMRLAASAAFGLLMIRCQSHKAIAANSVRGMSDAYAALAILFAIPILFYIASHTILASHELSGLSGALRAGYAYLPFVLLAGISVFPLTAVESLLLASPILSAQAVSGVLSGPLFDWPSFAGAFWLLALLTGVSSLAGMSQLAFLIVLVRQASRDPLTGACSRLSGQELLELQFDIARRGNNPLSIAFLDLDHFKCVNDRYGHEAGDVVLVEVVRNLSNRLRRTDILVRWGGEEFLLMMPNTSLPQARHALARLGEGWLGTRPDGKPVTASIGLAERLADSTADWKALIEIADRRMYHAKESGRNCVVSKDARIARLAGSATGLYAVP